MEKIKPTTLKGFRDYFAEDMIIRDFVIAKVKAVFKKYGFDPLETPSLEYTELILGQSGEEAEKLYYRFRDQGDRDVMLKYELMISMCRAVAENINTIQFPYKRYQIQPVWRAENIQKGRLREFTQMDIDTIGTKSLNADAEILQVGLEILTSLGFEKFQARISSRKILEGLLEYLDLPKAQFDGFYMTIDKLKKVGTDGVRKEFTEKRGFEKEKVDLALKILELKTLDELEDTVGTTSVGKEGIDEVRTILSLLERSNLPKEQYVFDITLARGLASYTGPIWELEIMDGGVGSVSGGGRYDNAISKYVGREIPATGTSFGLERLCEIIKDRNMYNLGKTYTDLLIVTMDENCIAKANESANILREQGLNVFLFPEITKIGNQMKYASKKSIPWVLIIGENEIQTNTVQLKNMDTSEQFNLKIEDVLQKVK